MGAGQDLGGCAPWPQRRTATGIKSVVFARSQVATLFSAEVWDVWQLLIFIY